MAWDIEAVALDVGETLVDETTEYGAWADWLGVPRQTFSAVFGATIARGLDYRRTFEVFSPGFDLATERRRRAEAGTPESFTVGDLYPDALPALGDLREMGLVVAVAGNQTRRAGAILTSLDLPVDLVATSDGLGAEKPDPAFFEELARLTPVPRERVLYVGDRPDNDIAPALAAGMQAAHIRRGPWGHILADSPDLRGCRYRVGSLTELVRLLRDERPT